MHGHFCSLQCNYIMICVIVCTVSSRAWPQAGQHQDHPVCLSGAEGPEQRLVPSVAGDLPVAAYKTVQNFKNLKSCIIYYLSEHFHHNFMVSFASFFLESLNCSLVFLHLLLTQTGTFETVLVRVPEGLIVTDFSFLKNTITYTIVLKQFWQKSPRCNCFRPLM